MTVFVCFLLTYCIYTSESTYNQPDARIANICMNAHTDQSIRCIQGSHIRVTDARYGQSSTQTCPGSVIKTVGQRGERVTDDIKTRCDGKQTCDAKKALMDSLIDPCPGSDKYFDIDYYCVKHGQTPTGLADNSKICVNRQFEAFIQCYTNKELHVKHVNYGQSSTIVCPGSHINTTGCTGVDVTSNFKTRCEKKHQCDVEAALMDSIRDPAPGNDKILRVNYFCDLVPPRSPWLSTSPRDPKEGEDIELRCATSAGGDLTFDFQRDGIMYRSSPTGIYTIQGASIGRDDATYTCTVTRGSKSSLKSNQVIIQLTPSTPKLSTFPQDPREGDDIELQCETSSAITRNVKFDFQRDGILYKTSATGTIQGTTTGRDDITYTCTVTKGSKSSLTSNKVIIQHCGSHQPPARPCDTSDPSCQTVLVSTICPVCQEGFVNDPEKSYACRDIDECQSNKKMCHYHGVEHQCVNSPGSYKCVCQDGHENVSPEFCDKTVDPPKRPDSKLPDTPAVHGPVFIMSANIVLFGLYVIIMDIRLIMAVLYRWCTTEPLSESDSSESDEEPESYVVCGGRKAYWEPQSLEKGRKCNNIWSARGEVIWVGHQNDIKASSQAHNDTSDIRTAVPRSGRTFSSFSSSTTEKPSSLYSSSTVTHSTFSSYNTLRPPRSKKFRKALRTSSSDSTLRSSFSTSTSHRNSSLVSHGSGRRSSLASSKNERHKSPAPPKSSSHTSVASSV